LNIIKQAPEDVSIFINIDIYNLPSFYTRDYKDIFKHLHKTSAPNYHQVKTILNTAMQYINPLYSTAYGSAPNIIGVTRRALSWSHLIRATCYEQNVVQAPKRYQITLPSDTPEVPETNRYIELNTNILYIDANDCATCIANYLKEAQIKLGGIIYIDADPQAVQSCINNLQQNMPNIPSIGLCVQNEALQQKSTELQDFNNYLEQLYAQVAQDTIEKKLKTINDEINKHKAKTNHLEQMCQQP
jgi:hypothetical protein